MNELGPEARAVVDAGREGDDPTGADRARVRAAMMQVLAAGGTAALATAAARSAVASVAPKAAAGSAAAAKASVFVGAGLAAKIATVVVISSAVAGGFAWSRASSPSESSPALLTSGVARAAAPAIAHTQERSRASSERDAQASSPSDGEEAAKAAAPKVEAPSPMMAAPAQSKAASAAQAHPAGSTEVDPLELETRSLGEARRAAQSGNPARALALIDAQNETYGHGRGQLEDEREAARVQALCDLGRVEEAKAAGARFIAAHPGSLQIDRVRASCAGSTR